MRLSEISKQKKLQKSEISQRLIISSQRTPVQLILRGNKCLWILKSIAETGYQTEQKLLSKRNVIGKCEDKYDFKLPQKLFYFNICGLSCSRSHQVL